MEALKQRIERIGISLVTRMSRVATEEAGQGTAEYIGIVALVAAAIATLSGMGAELATPIKNAIKAALEAIGG